MRPVRGARDSSLAGVLLGATFAVSAAEAVRLGRTLGAPFCVITPLPPAPGSSEFEPTYGSEAGIAEEVSGGTHLIYQILAVSVCAHLGTPKQAE